MADADARVVVDLTVRFGLHPKLNPKLTPVLGSLLTERMTVRTGRSASGDASPQGRSPITKGLGGKKGLKWHDISAHMNVLKNAFMSHINVSHTVFLCVFLLMFLLMSHINSGLTSHITYSRMV